MPTTGKSKDEMQISDIERRPVENFANFYVNNANVSSAFYDLSIIFSEIQAGPTEALVLDKCRVTMSPAHAKALGLALTENIRRWEAQFGEIKLPEGMVATDLGARGARQKKSGSRTY
jgi:hypothetical protein